MPKFKERSLRSASLYLLCFIFVAAWWFFFFSESPTPSLPTPPKREILPSEEKLSRNLLKRALQGDFPLMASLILQWDIEAQMDQKERLLADKVLRAQLLSHLIEKTVPPQNIKIMPQTYASAGILLTLASPEQLVALPRGLRKQTKLYPLETTKQIPLDLDQYTTEKIFLSHPSLAFVSSHYTHPATLQALCNQGIATVAAPHCQNLDDIVQEIGTIGHLSGCPEKAELLQLFIEAAVLKLDQEKKGTKNALFLSYYDHFYFPKESNITGTLVRKGELPLPSNISPFDLKEKLLKWDPERLIVAVPEGLDLLPFLQQDKGYQKLQAVKNGKVYFVDDALFQTPTHFAILAYYDLIQALK